VSAPKLMSSHNTGSFSTWSFLLSVLHQGTAIQMDYTAGKFPSYEHFAQHMDAAARDRDDELEQALKIHETALCLDTVMAERARLRSALINLTVAAKNAAEYLNAKGRRMPALNAAIADADCAFETIGDHS
jgi:hypothetical protein